MLLCVQLCLVYLSAVLNQVGGNMLVPEPGFSLYKTLGIAKGLDMRTYGLLVRSALLLRVL